MDKVCIIGLGYVGLPTALLAADVGYQVIGYDIDVVKVSQINSGIIATQEKGLLQRLLQALKRGNFRAQTHVEYADYFVIAVPTPLSVNNGADLKYVFAAVDSIVAHIRRGTTVIVESTVPVGTTDLIARMIEQKTGLKVGEQFFVAHAPERVLPGQAFKEIIQNARVIGGVTSCCAQRAADFYKKFVTGAVSMKSASFAEFIKLVENSTTDVHVAFAHEVAAMSQACGFDPYEVINVANGHPRVKIWTPTCGVGGHCIAVDPWFLINHMPDKTPLLQAARLVNDKRPLAVVKQIKQAVKQLCEQHNSATCTVQVLGLTYKPNVDDLRESPALVVVQELRKDPVIKLLVSEPHVERERLIPVVGDCLCEIDEGLQKADLVVVLVGHAIWHNIFDVVLCPLLDFSGLSLQRLSAQQLQKNCEIKNCVNSRSETVHEE